MKVSIPSCFHTEFHPTCAELHLHVAQLRCRTPAQGVREIQYRNTRQCLISFTQLQHRDTRQCLLPFTRIPAAIFHSTKAYYLSLNYSLQTFTRIPAAQRWSRRPTRATRNSSTGQLSEIQYDKHERIPPFTQPTLERMDL